MPELPEVEVTRRQIARVLVGRRIETVWVASPSYFFVTPPAQLKKVLLGRVVKELGRTGKYLHAELDDASSLVVHLGMTGQWSAAGLSRSDHIQFRLGLDSGTELVFRDVRKFGKVEWVRPGGSSARLARLGPDALEIGLGPFYERLQSRAIPMKSALLDQSILAGVGNIYADEALYQARIVPTRRARDVTRAEAATLLRAIRSILRASIRGGGSTINDYLQPDGELGGFQNWHKVYGKGGAPCPRCKTVLSRVVLGGRSTHFCARCQR
ncbi:MAG: DNA-formamidopyrimidine glycosylase [Sorangiineae bacterium NIC37A_2]|nr:MAG: DNA-formamidopyrimidine glycosylase [Sorangiineae bacterium NIC37A_2]